MTQWFIQAGFSSNPLSIKPGDSYQLIGREQITSEILTAISSGKILSIIGKYGFGKTSMLKKIISAFKGKRRVIYFACYRHVGELDLDLLLHERFGVLGKLLKLKSKKMILLLDEVEYLSPDDFTVVEQYVAQGYFHSVVLVTHDSSVIPIKHTQFSLDALKETSAVELIQTRLQGKELLSDVVIKKIYSHDSRIRKFLQNVEKVIMYSLDQDAPVKPSDVKKILEQFS
jgi:hypothetical protein